MRKYKFRALLTSLILSLSVLSLSGCGISKDVDVDSIEDIVNDVIEPVTDMVSDEVGQAFDSLTEAVESSLSEEDAEEEDFSEAYESFNKEESDSDTYSVVEEIAGDILSDDMSEYDKVKAIHDYIVLNVDYDYDNFLNDTIPGTSYTAEGALLTHSAVCEGYARAFDELCECAGIETLFVHGTGDNGTQVLSHAWNQVKIDGNWYNIDVTWDDPVIEESDADILNNIFYDYFLVPDDVFLANHFPENECHECSDDRYVESNRALTIEPYLTEPYTFVDSPQESLEIIKDYLSSGIYEFQIITDATESEAQARAEEIFNNAYSAMQTLNIYGECSANTMYGISDYVVVGICIKPQ